MQHEPTEQSTDFIHPVEIWGLVITRGECRGELVLVGGDDDVGAPFLAFTSDDEARENAQYQGDVWDIECEPVRLK